MSSKKNKTSVFLALTTLAGMTLAPVYAAQDATATVAASPPERTRCAFTAYTKGALQATANPAINASSRDVAIKATGVAICSVDGSKANFSFELKGHGNLSCEGASTFTGELQMEPSEKADVVPTFGADASKARLNQQDATDPGITRGALLVATGEFTSGLFKSSTATVTVKARRDCATTGVTQFFSRDLLLGIGPAR